MFLAVAILACSRKPAPAGMDAVTQFQVAERKILAVATPEPEPGAEPDTSVEPEVSDADQEVPTENREKGQPPDASSAEEGARALFEAIKNDDPSLATDFFFPAGAFDLVKNMENPGNYWRKLESWYAEDIHEEHERYFGVHAMEFDHFELGRCEWKEPLSQGNKLPYWSCRNSRIFVRSGSKLFDYRVKAIINWGARWYVIHLGPIR
jgi:hypothetical protein